jgi:hypothetical protein
MKINCFFFAEISKIQMSRNENVFSKIQIRKILEIPKGVTFGVFIVSGCNRL